MPQDNQRLGWLLRAIALVLICGFPGGPAWIADAAENDHRDAFLQWAKANARPVVTIEPGRGTADLQALKAMIGDARIIYLAHNGHVQTANPFGAMIPGYMPAGEYLSMFIGDAYLPFGFSVARGTGWNRGSAERSVIELPPVEADSLDGTLAEVGMPLFLIDLDSAPASGPVHEWLDQDRVQRAETMLPANNTRASWGVLFFVEEVSPAIQVEP